MPPRSPALRRAPVRLAGLLGGCLLVLVAVTAASDIGPKTSSGNVTSTTVPELTYRGPTSDLRATVARAVAGHDAELARFYTWAAALPAPKPPTPASPVASGDASPSAGGTVSSTAYCLTGAMANGAPAYRGAVAANRWPLGTRLRVSPSPVGEIVVVADRIGSGSELDFALPGDCSSALSWGRRTVTVEVV